VTLVPIWVGSPVYLLVHYVITKRHAAHTHWVYLIFAAKVGIWALCTPWHQRHYHFYCCLAATNWAFNAPPSQTGWFTVGAMVIIKLPNSLNRSFWWDYERRWSYGRRVRWASVALAWCSVAPVMVAHVADYHTYGLLRVNVVRHRLRVGWIWAAWIVAVIT
jgi:hypothetical protein